MSKIHSFTATSSLWGWGEVRIGRHCPEHHQILAHRPPRTRLSQGHILRGSGSQNYGGMANIVAMLYSPITTTCLLARYHALELEPQRFNTLENGSIETVEISETTKVLAKRTSYIYPFLSCHLMSWAGRSGSVRTW